MLLLFHIGGLTLTEVKKVARGARSEWFDLGIELDLKVEDLKVYCYFFEFYPHLEIYLIWYFRVQSIPGLFFARQTSLESRLM